MANGSQEALWEKVNDIAENGCAKREADGIRITNLEINVRDIGKKMDRVYYGSIVTLAAICVFLIKVVFFPK